MKASFERKADIGEMNLQSAQLTKDNTEASHISDSHQKDLMR
jgi:hypothetical protein